MKKFKCHRCPETIGVSDIHKINAIIKRSGWGVVYNIENGLVPVYFCPDCFAKAKRLAKELKEALGIDYFSLSSLLNTRSDS